MSANLLAELDAFYGGSASAASSNTARAPVIDHAPPLHVQGEPRLSHQTIKEGKQEEADEFGEFQGPAPTPKTSDSMVPTAEPKTYDPWADMQWSAPQTTTAVRPHALPATSSLVKQNPVVRNIASDDNIPSWQTTRSTQGLQRQPRDESVLFDADADDEVDDDQTYSHDILSDDDEFGAFEKAAAPSRSSKANIDIPAPRVVLSPIEPRPAIWEPPKRKTAPNLLDMNDEYLPTAERVSALRPQSQSQDDVLEDLGGWDSFQIADSRQVKSPNVLVEGETAREQPPRSADTHTPVQPEMESWEDFDEPFSTPTITKAASVDEQTQISLPLLLPKISTSNAVPPVNIPPPAILFTLFPDIFSLAQSTLLELLNHKALDNDQRHAFMLQPATKQFTQDYLEIVRTCAHIVGGRKNRWKRDAALAQSMRIGPASTSGKSGGMKLAGLDKGENAKEEREAAEVVAAWRRQAGKLRTAIAAVEGANHIPELSETMPIRMATQAEGALTSPKACVLCGLKRNERIAKVDSEVQDSFGEWWVEHWGHRACMAFWEGYKDQLPGR